MLVNMEQLKVLGAKWLVEMAEYISDNPQFIVNGLGVLEFVQHWMATEKTMHQKEKTQKMKIF